MSDRSPLPPARRPEAGTLRLASPLLLVLAMLLLAVPYAALRPAYAPPPILAGDGLPPGAVPVGATYGERLRLVGYALTPGSYRQGDSVPVTLYLRREATGGEALSLFLHLFGRGMGKVGQVDTYPGSGLLEGDAWRAGQVIADRYLVPVQEDMELPAALDLVVGVYRLESGAVLAPVLSDGRGVAEIRIQAGALRPGRVVEAASPTQALDVTFGDDLRLIGFDAPAEARPGQEVIVALYWKAERSLDEDYTSFVHLLGEGPEPLVQADGQPRSGDYPTSLWLPGEVVVDRKTLTLPADLSSADYTLAIGLYPAPGAPNLTPGASDDGHGRLVLTRIEVR